MKLIFVAVFAACACFVNAQLVCRTPSGELGDCISLENCQSLLDLVNKKDKTTQDSDMVIKSHCGFKEQIFQVCCPRPAPGQALESQNNICYTPEGNVGECISLFSCPHLEEVVKPFAPKENVSYVQRFRCEGPDDPSVCCAPPANTANPLLSTPIKVGNPNQEPQSTICYTPEGIAGECVGLYSCAHLANMLKPPVSSVTIAYLQKSKCDGTEQYSVCCGPPADNKGPITPGHCKDKMNAFPPDPLSGCCGVDVALKNKIVGGNETTIDQYPWLAIIEYEKQGVTKLLCGGALISGKYVLTAGHCLVGPALSIGTPKRVRLGEYDISHEGPDCVPSGESGVEDCTDGITRINIEKTIPHPQYDHVDPRKRNDIALIRLTDTAPFTDFIRPICLPTEDLTLPQNRPVDFTLYAAGWGAVSSSQSNSNIKRHVDLPFVSQENCQLAYSNPRRSVTLWKGHICAGGQSGKDSCKGDNGGPIMYEQGRTYKIAGIISFGPVPCALEGVPGVNTYVYEYLDWIKNTIVP